MWFRFVSQGTDSENMVKKVLLVLHQATSDPGRVGEALRTRGFELDMRIPAIGDPLPQTMGDHAAAVIFGGPMSANDDHEDFIREETKLIDRILQSETPYHRSNVYLVVQEY